jgi:TolB-like protein/class 3 adenylate cyclase
MERRLTAILAADVVGYSRLMGADEAGTLEALKSIRSDLLDPKATQYGGRTIKLMGDGALMEFPSVVDAVTFAVEVQWGLRDRGIDAPEDHRITYRIGINIGDVIVEGDDIYGDGVNVAARLEGLADPGGVCLSRNVFEQVESKLDLTFEYLGEREVKNIVEPVMIYRIVFDDKAAKLVTPVQGVETQSTRRPRLVAMALAITVAAAAGWAIWWQHREPEGTPIPAATSKNPQTNRLYLAVLPFANISNDSTQEYFADGMTEDLITDLSKLSDLALISRSTVAGYKGRNVDIREIGRDLGASYVIEGSVRKSGDQVRINVQLNDVITGSSLWAERYDESESNIFNLQNRILSKIVNSLALTLSEQERRRLAFRGTESVVAHDLYLKGLFEESRFTREGNEKAVRLYEQALSIDPDYPLPYARISQILQSNPRYGWSDDVESDLIKAVRYAEQALDLDENNPSLHWNYGRAIVRLHTRDSLKRGIKSMERAIELDPDYADAYAFLSDFYLADGRADDSIRAIETAMRINPRYPFWYLFMRGQARYMIEDYDNAIDDFEKATERSPTAMWLRWWLAMSYAQVGRREDAQWQVDELMSMGFSGNIRTITETQAIQHPSFLKLYVEGLRKAGIPE